MPLINNNFLIHKIICSIELLILSRKNPRLLLLKILPKSAVCAEIGIWKGEFSRAILRYTYPRKFHMIDPWAFQCELSERRYGGSIAKKQKDMDIMYNAVKDEFEKYENITIHRGFSENVLQEFEDHYFDWIYIDGNHSYEYVTKDLDIALSKVKPGGMISGDDYTWGRKDAFPVKRAVHDFVIKNRMQKHLKIIESQFIIGLGASFKKFSKMPVNSPKEIS